MNILCVKLTTSEDLIGRVEEEILTEGQTSTGTITLKQARVISLQEVPGGRMAMALLPYLMGDQDADVVINLDKHVICTYKAVDGIEDAYLKQTSPVDLTAKSKIQLS